MADPRPFSGPRAKIFVTGAAGRLEIGWATNVSGTVTSQNVRIDTLGSAFSREIEPVGVVVTFSADVVRILDTTLVDLGVDPTQGDTTNYVNFPPLEVDVYDEVGDSVVESISGARMSQRTWSVQARGIMSEQVAFEATKIRSVAA
jgi:hypothetical protein